jgi:hypothetical protein
VANKPGTVSRYWKVTQHKKGVEVIAAYDQGDPAIVERVVGKAAGKVVLLTTPIEERTPEWNNYNKSLMISFYFGLTMSCARYLCAEAETAPLNFQFGRQMPRFAATGRAFPKYVLSAADFSEDVRLTDKGVWSPDRLTKPGNYTLSGVSDESSDATPLYRFSINLAPEESDLSRVSVAEIEMELGKNTVIAQDRRRSLADSLDWDEPVELFPWLMIALLFLLALENLLANRFYRSLAV